MQTYNLHSIHIFTTEKAYAYAIPKGALLHPLAKSQTLKWVLQKLKEPIKKELEK